LTTNWTILAFLGYILAVYALAAIAHHLSKGKSFIKEYFLGSRSLGPWTLALTLAATSASGGTFTGFPSLIYTYGWVLALWIAGYMVVPLCVMGLLGKRINQVARKSDAVTFPDVFRDRYESPWLGTLTCLLLIFFLAVYLIPQFKAGGVLMQTLFNEVPAFQRFSAIFDGLAENLDGISSGYLAGLAIFTVSVVLYTAYGGFRAVVLTDVMQGLIMGLGITILLPLTLYAAYVYLDPVASSNPRERVQSAATSGKESRAEEPVRFGQLIEGLEKVNGRLAQDDPAALTAPGQKKVETPEGIRFDSFLPLGMAISFFFFWPISGTGQAPNMLRLMAFRDTKTLARSIFTVTIFFGTIYLPLVVIFVAAKTLPLEIEQPDQVMPAITLFVAPPLLAGLLIAAPYAAIMSTVDSFRSLPAFDQPGCLGEGDETDQPYDHSPGGFRGDDLRGQPASVSSGLDCLRFRRTIGHLPGGDGDDALLAKGQRVRDGMRDDRGFFGGGRDVSDRKNADRGVRTLDAVRSASVPMGVIRFSARGDSRIARDGAPVEGIDVAVLLSGEEAVDKLPPARGSRPWLPLCRPSGTENRNPVRGGTEVARGVNPWRASNRKDLIK
jgi:Na+/pantothenate symporter